MQKLGQSLRLSVFAPSLMHATADVLGSIQEKPLGLQAMLFQTSGAEVSLASVVVEILCFCAAFAVIRLLVKPRQQSKGGKSGRLHKKVADSPTELRELPPLKAWRRISRKGLVSSRDMQMWAAKVLREDPDDFVKEFVSHLEQHRGSPEHRDAAKLILNIIAKEGRPDLVESFARAAQSQAGVEVDPACLDYALLGAYAANGQTQEVDDLLRKERAGAEGGKAALRSFASAVRGYLSRGKIQQAMAKLDEMRTEGHDVPVSALAELSRAACKFSSDPLDVLAWLEGRHGLPSEVVSVMLDHCVQNDDLNIARSIHASAQAAKTDLMEDACESLLKLYSKVDDSSGVDLFANMLSSGFVPCEGFCRSIIARCSDSRNTRLAENLVDFLRSRKEATFATYKTLMKVYAFASLYDKACDLYTEIKDLGMEPDTVMYGSLLKFAVKAGRTTLAHEIFEKADGGCVQNYMWLIRAAGQEGDVDRAISIFRSLQQAQPKLVDHMAFNIVVDACASNKDMQRAKELLEEMRQTHAFNLVTYNTMMKGYIGVGEIKAARGILNDMEAAGVVPDAATFSCLLSGAVKLGHLRDAWSVIDEMDRRRVAPDSYVVSIMMQAARKAQNPRDADRLLLIVDRPDVRICDDEVVFNTVLDACIFRRDRRRLSWILDEYCKSSVRPTVRTFGLLIKACSILQRTQRCWDFWKEMITDRGVQPNDVTLGCMIDALVEAQRIDEAMTLFQEWKHKVQCDTIIYSTLIKGFSSTGDAERAMALYRDMKLSGVQLNNIVYTALINAHTRKGSMAKAEGLLEEMQKEGCEPNTITYSSLVKGHCVRGDLEAALGVFHKMMDLGFKADSVIFNTLLDGCVRNNNWSLGDELLDKMECLGLQPTNFTLSILVKMWSKRGDLDKAFECIYSTLRDPQGYKRVDAQVGACIVGACMHNRRPDRALEVFHEMKGWKNFDGPDANTYSALISGLPRHGFVRKAAQLAEEACAALSVKAYGQDRRSLAPNALQQLYRAMKQEGLLQEIGVPLAGKLRKAGMSVDPHWLN